MRLNKIYFLVLFFFIVSCGNSQETMGREFRTMQSCVEFMEGVSRGKLDIVQDKSNIVSGKLANGKFFGCKKKSTGTKGEIIDGWYMVDVKK